MVQLHFPVKLSEGRMKVKIRACTVSTHSFYCENTQLAPWQQKACTVSTQNLYNENTELVLCQAIYTSVLPASETHVNQKNLYHLNTLHLHPAKTNKDSKTNKERVTEFLYQAVELPTSDCSTFTENEGLVQIKVTRTNHDFGPGYKLH